MLAPYCLSLVYVSPVFQNVPLTPFHLASRLSYKLMTDSALGLSATLCIDAVFKFLDKVFPHNGQLAILVNQYSRLLFQYSSSISKKIYSRLQGRNLSRADIKNQVLSQHESTKRDSCFSRILENFFFIFTSHSRSRAISISLSLLKKRVKEFFFTFHFSKKVKAF